MLMKLAFFTFALTVLSGHILFSQSDNRGNTSPSLARYFTISGEGGIGLMNDWNDSEDLLLERFGLHGLLDRSRVSRNYRFAFSRVTKSGKLAWGLSFHRYLNEMRYGLLNFQARALDTFL